MTIEDPDIVIAHHEAGHAVVSYHLRGYIGTITIQPPDDRHSGGAEVWTLLPSLVDEDGDLVGKDAYTSEESECLRDAARIAMAGAIAETILWEHRIYEDVLSKNRCDEKKVHALTQALRGAKAGEVEMELASDVRELLTKEWCAVARLAGILEQRRSVTGADAVAAIEGSCGE